MGIKRDSFWVFLTSCLLVLLELGIQVILARALGAEGRGSFAVCWTFLNILLIIGVFGVGDANTYYLASSKSTISQVFGASICIGIIGSLIISFGAYWFIRLPLAFFTKASRTEFLLSIIAVCPFVLSLYLVAILRGTFSYRAMNVISLSGSLGALIGVYVLCFQLRLGANGAIVALMVRPISIIAFTVVRLWPELVFKDLVGGFKQVRGILHYAFRACFGFFATRMSTQVGVLVMACFLARADVGFYAIALAITVRILMVPNSLRIILMPKLTQLHASDGVLVCRSLRIMVPTVALLAAGVASISRPFIKYGLGEEFMPALTAIYILLIGVVFKSVSEFGTTYLLAINRPGVSSSIKFSGVFINFVLLIILVRAYGLIGGCVATVLSYMLEALVMTLVFMRISGVKSWRSLVLQKNDAAYLWDSACSLVGCFTQQR